MDESISSWCAFFIFISSPEPAPGLYTCIKSWKICIKLDFKEISLKLTRKEWSDKIFLFTSKLCPLGAVCPCPGAIYMYKIMKKMYKIRIQRDCFETWEYSSAQPGARRRAGGHICHYLSWTDSIKPSLLFSNFGCCVSKGSLFRLFATNDEVTRGFCWHQNFVSWGCLLQLYTFIKSWKDVYKVGGWRDSF